MELSFKPVCRRQDDYKNIKRLYRTAFPKEERAPLWFLLKKAKWQNIDFSAVYDGGKWVGIIYAVTDSMLTYVMYLAIQETERGSGYGSEVLKAIAKRYRGTRLVLSIEELNEAAPNYKQRVRRKEFYLKNGFQDLNCRVKEFGVTYELLSFGGNVSKEEYKELIQSFRPKLLAGFFAGS